MFEQISDRLERALKLLKGQGKITEVNIAETVKDIRKSLLEADVNYKVAKTFTDRVKNLALGENVLTSISPSDLMVNIVHRELSSLIGGETSNLNLSKTPTVILMTGLQGSGKTTFSGKLAKMLKDKLSKTPLLVADDVHRPAAIDQLKAIGEQIGVDVYIELENKNPVQIAQNSLKKASQSGNDVVIIDTAGRLAIDETMMNEIISIKLAIRPNEILFVVDAMLGQDAATTAKKFNEQLDFTGVVLTKLDGDTRGGAALSVCAMTNKPIKLIGKGEKLDAIEIFHPKRMADRILGMGDIVSLVEKAQEQYDEKVANRLQKKIAKNRFDVNDFLMQIQQIKKMGDLGDLLRMIPGFSKKIKDNNSINDQMFTSLEVIIHSMTLEERANPSILNVSRKIRIAKGSGKKLLEVNQFLHQFEQVRKAIKGIKNKKFLYDLFNNRLIKS